MENKDILFLSTNRFNDFPSRKTRFSKFLSSVGYRVVYVESPHTYLAYLKKGFRVENLHKLEQISQNYFVLRSFPIFPFFKKYALFNAIDDEIYHRNIKNALKEISFQPKVVFTYLPFFPNTLKKFKSRIVYDCVDDHAQFGGLLDKDFVNKLEKSVVELSDLVITTGNEKLYQKIASFGKKPVQIPNGVDYPLFSQWLKDLSNLKIKKRIIYVGAIASWFDVELVKSVSEHFKDFEITLIGFNQIDISTLLSQSNVKFLGKLPQEAFAPILWESSVAMIPFKVNDLTQKIDPLKVYEYLASGVPVVSTPVGNVSHIPFVYTANTIEDFIHRIEEAIKTDTIEKRVERSNFAKEFSWENRFKEILQIVEELTKNG